MYKSMIFAAGRGGGLARRWEKCYNSIGFMNTIHIISGPVCCAADGSGQAVPPSGIPGCRRVKGKQVRFLYDLVTVMGQCCTICHWQGTAGKACSAKGPSARKPAVLLVQGGFPDHEALIVPPGCSRIPFRCPRSDRTQGIYA